VITIAVSFVIRALLVAANTTACPEPQVPQGPWTGTALRRAIQYNDVKAARRLMNAATVNERDSLGNTPLVAALTPSVLLEPAGIVGARQRRAQIESESRARQAIAFSLLTKGASATEASATGIRPLMQLAAWGYSPAIDRRLAQQLLQRGADVNAIDDSGMTALMLAARRGKTDLVNLLVSKGADLSLRNCHGHDAASLAKFGGHARLAEELARPQTVRSR